MEILNAEGKGKVELTVPKGKIGKLNHILFGISSYGQREVSVAINQVKMKTINPAEINPAQGERRFLDLVGHFFAPGDTITLEDPEAKEGLRISMILKDI